MSNKKWEKVKTLVKTTSLSVGILTLTSCTGGHDRFVVKDEGKACHNLEDFIPKQDINFASSLNVNGKIISVSQIRISKADNYNWEHTSATKIGEISNVFSRKKYFLSKEGIHSDYTDMFGKYSLELRLKKDLSGGAVISKTEDGDQKVIIDPCYQTIINGKSYQGIAVVDEIKRVDGKYVHSVNYYFTGMGGYAFGSNENTVKQYNDWKTEKIIGSIEGAGTEGRLPASK